MRISSATLLISGVSFAIANPLHLVVIEKVEIPEVLPFRLGHAAAPANLGPPAEPAMIHSPLPMRPEFEFTQTSTHSPLPFCQEEEQTGIDAVKTKLANSLHRFGNYFREMMGLPEVVQDLPAPGVSCIPPPPKPTLSKPCHGSENVHSEQGGHGIHIMPFPFVPGSVAMSSVPESSHPRPVSTSQSMWLHRHVGSTTSHRPDTFGGRLQKALYALSPWEGRALAFVVGCGIGVLLRMLYVFAVLSVRAIRCNKKDQRQYEELEVDVIEEELLFEVPVVMEVPPPVYNEKREMDQQ